jgi:hypothetical protein
MMAAMIWSALKRLFGSWNPVPGKEADTVRVISYRGRKVVYREHEMTVLETHLIDGNHRLSWNHEALHKLEWSQLESIPYELFRSETISAMLRLFAASSLVLSMSCSGPKVLGVWI